MHPLLVLVILMLISCQKSCATLILFIIVSAKQCTMYWRTAAVVNCTESSLVVMYFCCSAESQPEESSNDRATTLNVTCPPRQQAPPTDDSDALFPSPPFPSPPPELSCHVTDATAFPWPRDSQDSVPFVTDAETAPSTCSVDQNFVKPVVQCSESDGSVLETNIDEAMRSNDAENVNSVLALIRKGVKLRKTVMNDRSAPKLD